MNKNKIWRLKSKEERRFKQGHPWVYSNELQESPKGIAPGDWIELHDASGNFLAYGFGNPHSLIAFRALSRIKDEVSTLHVGFFEKKITQAFQFRLEWFKSTESFRLIYGEADSLPGLVIDRFFGKDSDGKAQVVYVVQPHAFGMDLHLELILKALEKVSLQFDSKIEASVVLRRDASSREREGMERLPTVVKKLDSVSLASENGSEEPLRQFWFQVPGGVELKSDLIGGQKTGFFFDQLQNIEHTEQLFQKKLARHPDQDYRVLDLCSYIGQWSVHLTKQFLQFQKLNASQKAATKIEVTCVDASDPALVFAEANFHHLLRAEGVKNNAHFRRLKADVLEPMPTLEGNTYDVVIADPPAFMKNRKSMPQGKHAYINLMTTAIQKTAPNGLVVCCSCSQLLSRDEFLDVLTKATKRSGKKVRWLTQGTASLDHFARFEFQEGHYLKCWIGQVDGA